MKLRRMWLVWTNYVAVFLSSFTANKQDSSLLPLTEPPIPSPSITSIVYINYIVHLDTALLTVVEVHQLNRLQYNA